MSDAETTKRWYLQVMGGLPRCAVCGAEHDRWRPSGAPQSYCRECHNAKSRKWKRENPPNEEQRRKGIARSIAHVYRDRGVIERKPCVACGAEEAEMHHPDYSKPLEVIWLCRPCHRAEHRKAESPTPTRAA